MKWGGKRRHVLPLFDSPNDHNDQDSASLKLCWDQSSGWQGSSTWIFFCCFLWCISKELGQRRAAGFPPVLKWDTGIAGRPMPMLLPHNTNPVGVTLTCMLSSYFFCQGNFRFTLHNLPFCEEISQLLFLLIHCFPLQGSSFGFYSTEIIFKSYSTGKYLRTISLLRSQYTQYKRDWNNSIVNSKKST